MKLYHVTPIKNLKSIMTNGLIPKIGQRSRMIKENTPTIYFFNSLADVSNGLDNWFGELFDEESRLALLCVVVPDHLVVDACGWEKNVMAVIKPESIMILSRDVLSVNNIENLEN